MTMFHVICEDTGIPVMDGHGIPFVFPYGQDANDRARALTRMTGRKHRPQRIVTEAWVERENARFAEGKYQGLPWYWEEWYRKTHAELKHFAHLALAKESMVAFTESSEKGAADIQTRMRPGTYLQRYYTESLKAYCRTDDVSNVIKDFATGFAAQYDVLELLMATAEDEIEYVYRHGPSSCMAHPARGYASRTKDGSEYHPVRLYADSDLALAYIRVKDAISARAICWPDKKLYSRIYGDEVRMRAAFSAEGWTAGSMEGAKLRRIEFKPGRLVCPYIDNIPRMRDEGDHLVLDHKGPLSCDFTDGTSYCKARVFCARCNSVMSGDEYEDDAYTVEGALWCCDCVDNYAFWCEATGQHYNADTTDQYAIEDRNGETWCGDYFRAHGFTCAGNGNHYSNSTIRFHMASGEVWSENYFRAHGFTCEECNANFHTDDADDETEHQHDELICKGCAAKRTAKKPPADALRCTAGKHRSKQGVDHQEGQLVLELLNGQIGDRLEIFGHRWLADGIYPITYLSRSNSGMPYRVHSPNGNDYWVRIYHIRRVIPRVGQPELLLPSIPLTPTRF
jgi:hypothetical protein